MGASVLQDLAVRDYDFREKKTTRIAGGFSFSGIALTDTGGAGVRFIVGLPAMHIIFATRKRVGTMQAFSSGEGGKTQGFDG